MCLYSLFLIQRRITELVLIMLPITNTYKVEDFEAGEGPGHRSRHQVTEMSSPRLKSCLHIQLCAFWWGIHPTVSVVAMSRLPKSAAP